MAVAVVAAAASVVDVAVPGADGWLAAAGALPAICRLAQASAKYMYSQ